MTKHVLLVDDQPDLASVLAAAFKRAGFETRVAHDGDIALGMFREQAFDAVVTDIIMPNREGFETVREIRKLSASVVVIAMSGGGRIGTEHLQGLAVALGADAFISKPFRPSEVLALTQKKLLEREAAAAPAG